MVMQVTTTAVDHEERSPLETAIVGVDPESATSLRSAFEAMFAQAEEWSTRARAIRVTSETQTREMKFARESRLALREIRVAVEHKRKALKEDGVRRGKAIDGIANVFKALVEPLERHLLEQESFAERAEAARKDALKSAREDALRGYGTDPIVYASLGEMSEEAWAHILEIARLAKEAREEEARQAEAIRIEAQRLELEARARRAAEAAAREAERIEAARVQAEENARLRREAAAADEARRAELARVEAERAEERAAHEAELASQRRTREIIEQQAARERAAVEAAARAERIAAEAAARQERDAREAAERELAEARAAEATQRAEAERARRAAALAPDREKLVAIASAIRAVALPPMTTPEGQEASAKVAAQFGKMVSWIEKVAREIGE